MTTYRLGRANVLRVAGVGAAALGLCWVVTALMGLPSAGVVALAVLTGCLLLATAVLALWPPRVLDLDADGYRVRLVRGAGESQAQWRSVDSVETAPVGGALCLVVSLSGGRSSVIPLSLLGSRSAQAQREIHERLNAAHGYRRLDVP
ncbi:MAG: hypothetical protein ACR2LE_03510 [Nocardioidaceae bacterium]